MILMCWISSRDVHTCFEALKPPRKAISIQRKLLRAKKNSNKYYRNVFCCRFLEQLMFCVNGEGTREMLWLKGTLFLASCRYLWRFNSGFVWRDARVAQASDGIGIFRDVLEGKGATNSKAASRSLQRHAKEIWTKEEGLHEIPYGWGEKVTL